MSASEKPFLEHLEELRLRLFACLIAVGAGTVGCFFFVDRLLALMMRPAAEVIGTLYFLTPTEAFVMKIKVAFMAGLLLASPVVLSQAWLFVAPALKENERKRVVPLLAVISALFIAGVAFCYAMVLPAALKFLIAQQGPWLKPMISAGGYMDFLFATLLAFGVAFNLPVFVLSLAAMGFVSSRLLFRYQRHAIVLIFVAAAVLTPGPDMASQLLLAAPLLILYELSAVAVKFLEIIRRREAPEKAA